MSRITDFNLGPRVSMGTALLAVMVMSLACSMSMQYGHADVPMAIQAMK